MNIYADLLAYGLGPSGSLPCLLGFGIILNTGKLTKQAEGQKK